MGGQYSDDPKNKRYVEGDNFECLFYIKLGDAPYIFLIKSLNLANFK